MVVTVGFPLLASAPASADSPDPVGPLLGAVGGAVSTSTQPLPQAVTPRTSSSPTTKSSSSSVTAGSHHTPLVTVSGNQAGTDASGAPRGQATTLGVAGRPVVGSHAAGGGSGRSQVPDNPLCQATGGALCLRALYADSAASSTSATTATGLAALCVGGADPTGATCSGQQIGLAQGSAGYDTDGSSSSAADLANVCLRLDGADCEVGAEVLGSASGATTDQQTGHQTGYKAGHQTGQPVLLSLVLGGTRIELPRETSHLDAPTGCGSPDLLCSVLNASQSGSTGQDKHAVAATALADLLTASAGSSSSTTPATSAGTPPVDPTNGATAQLVDLDTADQPLLGVSQNSSTDDGHQADGDASLLSVAGVELVGAHSTSNGGGDDAQHLGLDTPLCTLTSGSVCADLLYADSSASHRADGSDVDTDSGLASLCLVGDDPAGQQCSGLGLGVGQGESHFHRTDAGASSASGTSLADLCLSSDTGCALSGEVLSSQGAADSQGNHGSSGSAATVGLGGTTVGAPADPMALSVPDGCDGTTTGAPVCVLLDQNDQGASSKGASAAQSVLQLGAVGGVLGLTGAQTTAGATVSAPTGTPVGGTPVLGQPVPAHPLTAVHSSTGSHPAGTVATETAHAAAFAQAIPNTGGPWVGAIPLGLALLIAGMLGIRRSWAEEALEQGA